MKNCVSLDALRRFGHAAMAAVGCVPEQANIFIESLLWADATGRSTHGFWRLPTYVKRLNLGLINTCPEPQLVAETSSLASVDGDNGLGQYVGEFASRKAADFATVCGIGAVTVRNSNHFGAAGFFAGRLADKGLIAIVVSNSMPRIAPSGGQRAVFGTNPFAFAAPLRNQAPILVDFAVSAMSGAEVMLHAADGRQLPEGIAIDDQGKSLLDPRELATGALLPFGGHKGYGIALLIEILAGVLSGAGISHGVGSMFGDFTRASNTGHFVLAIDPKKLWPKIDEYYERSEQLLRLILEAGEKGSVRIPGEQTAARLRHAKSNGIELSSDVSAALNTLAAELDIENLQHLL